MKRCLRRFIPVDKAMDDGLQVNIAVKQVKLTSGIIAVFR